MPLEKGIITPSHLTGASTSWLATLIPKHNIFTKINSGLLSTLMYSTVSNIFGFRVVVDSSGAIARKTSVLLYVLVVPILTGVPVGRENRADTYLESTKWSALRVKGFLTPPLH